jgi:hypothetical protein
MVEMNASERAIKAAAHIVTAVVPYVVAISDETIVFTGEGPYLVGDLLGLLPDDVNAAEEELPSDAAVDIVVIGLDEYSEGLITSAAAQAPPPRFVPQEGFLDSILFGYDWWTDDVATLNRFVDWHPGLAFAKSLASDNFEWPTTDAEESSHLQPEIGEFQEQTELRRLGYQITGLTRSQRWQILIAAAVPKLGLRIVAETIANNTRLRKKQHNGRQRYAYAIGEWEYDLGRLHREFYAPAGHGFQWPNTDA